MMQNNNMENIIKTILAFPYTPYILVIFFAVVIIILIPFITLITTINKVSKLFANKNYTYVIRIVEKYFKFHKYEKTLLSFLYDSYYNLNNKQKALHYMQIAVEKGFIKDKYLKMFHNTRMAQILFDLNQTTESFEKLYEVYQEGEYEANWCLLFGKIFLSQKQFENAIYYLERALFISKKSSEIYFFYTLALVFKLKDRSLVNAMDLFIKNNKKEAIFIIAYSYIFKKYYSDAKLWLSKASFPDNEILESYRKLLILYCAYNIHNKKNESRDEIKTNEDINIILKEINTTEEDSRKTKTEEESQYNSKPDFSIINGEKTEFLISLNNALKSDSLESLKSILLESALLLLKLIGDEQNVKHFLISGKSENLIAESEDLINSQKIENFIKRVQQGNILLDIFGLSIKKALIPPAEFIKKEFEQLKPTATQTEQTRKTILSQYLRLTDRGFVKVNLRIVRLFEYVPTKIRSTFIHNKGISSLRILATAIEYPHQLALFIFRRTETYDLSYKLFETISRDLEQQDIKECYFFYNFPIDPDAQNYLQDFPNITVYDQAHLSLFLEESYKNK